MIDYGSERLNKMRDIFAADNVIVNAHDLVLLIAASRSFFRNMSPGTEGFNSLATAISRSTASLEKKFT